MARFRVLFVDNHLLLVHKPAGLATQPTPTALESLEGHCKSWIKQHYHKPGNVFLHAIHRLDKPVAGIVLFARSSKALSRLNAAMRAKKMQKRYLAEVEGRLQPAEGHLEHYLLHGDHYAHLVAAHTVGAKQALLSYSVREHRSTTSLVEISLETGRYHQIRAQMAAIGHPIVGDHKYGSQMAPAGAAGTIGLRHVSFAFPHPISGEQLSFTIK
jgi:23S rRNA pseudouridine1911/1915/1917 synthase